MIYPGDIKTIILSLTNPTGANPNVTVAPIVSVIQISTQSIVLSAQTLTLVGGTQAVYYYSWSTSGLSVGDYLSIISYAADGITVNGRFLEIFRLGDTNITGPVALNATVALNSTVAKDATVAHLTDLSAIDPNTSSIVLSIKANTDNLPADPASNTVIDGLIDTMDSVYNYTFGTWTIDKTQNPQVLTILAPGGSSLGSFTLSDSSTATVRAPQ